MKMFYSGLYCPVYKSPWSDIAFADRSANICMLQIRISFLLLIVVVVIDGIQTTENLKLSFRDQLKLTL